MRSDMEQQSGAIVCLGLLTANAQTRAGGGLAQILNSAVLSP
jgi:hypothetical protein